MMSERSGSSSLERFQHASRNLAGLRLPVQDAHAGSVNKRLGKTCYSYPKPSSILRTMY